MMIQRAAAYIHIADHPVRHEIGSGELNYQNIVKFIDEKGYDGLIGIGFFPENTDHEAVLSNKLYLSQ